MQLAMEMPELVDASTIYGEQREKLKEAILLVSMEGLMPAFEHLKKIRDPATLALPVLNRKQLYEDFTRALWNAYGHLMQKAAKMMEPNFGFLFQRDTQFEAGLAAWIKKHSQMAPASQYLRTRRTDWQTELNNFRNYLEHGDETDPKAYANHYTPAHAEALFEKVWRTIADILAMLVSLHLPPGTSLVEISPEKRHPVRPRRFQYAVRGLTGSG